MLAASRMEIDKQKELFDKFCAIKFTSSKTTSKTITQDKGKKIVAVLQGHPVAKEYGSKFKFFQL